MGLGYIGLPTAIIAAGSGIQVIGVDVNPKVVEMTNRGVIHIVEPGLQELCSEVVESGKLKASDVPEESDVYPVSYTHLRGYDIICRRRKHCVQYG